MIGTTSSWISLYYTICLFFDINFTQISLLLNDFTIHVFYDIFHSEYNNCKDNELYIIPITYDTGCYFDFENVTVICYDDHNDRKRLNRALNSYNYHYYICNIRDYIFCRVFSLVFVF